MEANRVGAGEALMLNMAGNVAEAIRVVSPWGVDVASGVESSIACKESALVRHFVQNARSSL